MSTEPTGPSEAPTTDELGAAPVPPSPDNPYQSPSAPTAREVGPGDTSVGGDRFTPIRWASTAAIVGLSFSVGIAILSIYATLDVYWISLASHGDAVVAPARAAGADQFVASGSRDCRVVDPTRKSERSLVVLESMDSVCGEP